MKKCKIKDVIEKEFKGLWGTDFDNNGIPVIKTNNMTYEGRINFSDICYRNISLDDAKENLLQKGDLIIEKSGGTKTHSVGYVNIFEGIDNKFVCNNFILPIRPKKDLVIPKFLFWQLHSMYKTERFSDCFNKTTGIQNLQKKTYFDKEIYLYDISIQKQIANHLDTIQAAIDNKQQQLKELDELVKSRFIEMFGDVYIYPKYEVKKMGEICTVQQGLQIPIAKRLTNSDGDNCYKYITIQYLNGGKTVEYIKNPRKSVLCDYEDVLMTRTGNTGQVVTNVNGCFHNNFFRIDYDKSKLDRIYFIEFLSQDNVKQDMLRKATTTTIPDLSHCDFFKIPIILPPLELQNSFASFVQQIDKSKFVVKQQIKDLQELMDSKMQEYFGE